MTAHKTPRVIGVGLLITAALGVGLIAFGARRPQAIPATSPNETTSPTPTSPAALTPTATPSPVPDTESLGQEAAQALVKLVVPADDIFNHAQGSGSIVDGERGLILTNWHILAAPSGILYNDGGYAKVYLTEGLDQFPEIAYWAQLLPECSDPALDLALLQITHRADDLTPVQRPLELPSVRLKGEGTLHTGEAVLILGFPDYAAGRPSWSEGHIVTHDSRWIKSDAEISHGHSGGMMLDQRGQLIGVPTQYQDTSVNSALAKARPVDLIRALVEDARAQEPIPVQPLRRHPSAADTLRVVVGTEYLDFMIDDEELSLFDSELERGTLVEVLEDPKWHDDTLWYHVQVIGTRMVGWVDGSYLASWDVVREPILFASDRAGSFDLYRMLVDGTGLARLTEAPGDEGFPSWSPDREAIVFSAVRDDNPDLFVLTPGDEDWTRLTDDEADDLYPAWSPDGSRIAFASDRDGDWDIFLLDADGTDPRPVTANDADDIAPAWSPDGTRLVYTSRRGGNADLYLLDLETGTAEQLTTNPYDDTHPTWSPQGDQIAYVAVTPEAGAERRQVAVLTVGAPEDVRAIVPLEPGEAPHGHVTWSPDGEWILFTTERDGNSEIYLAPASGAWSTNLTTTEFANDDTPAW